MTTEYVRMRLQSTAMMTVFGSDERPDIVSKLAILACVVADLRATELYHDYQEAVVAILDELDNRTAYFLLFIIKCRRLRWISHTDKNEWPNGRPHLWQVATREVIQARVSASTMFGVMVVDPMRFLLLDVVGGGSNSGNNNQPMMLRTTPRFLEDPFGVNPLWPTVDMSGTSVSEPYEWHFTSVLEPAEFRFTHIIPPPTPTAASFVQREQPLSWPGAQCPPLRKSKRLRTTPMFADNFY